MSRNPLHDVAIVGVYKTRQATALEGVREIDLVLEAAKGALERSGGLLSFSHPGTAQLLQKVIASAQQLRGELPESLSVPGANVVMTSNGGAGALFCDAMLLGRERP